MSLYKSQAGVKAKDSMSEEILQEKQPPIQDSKEHNLAQIRKQLEQERLARMQAEERAAQYERQILRGLRSKRRTRKMMNLTLTESALKRRSRSLRLRRRRLASRLFSRKLQEHWLKKDRISG